MRVRVHAGTGTDNYRNHRDHLPSRRSCSTWLLSAAARAMIDDAVVTIVYVPHGGNRLQYLGSISTYDRKLHTNG